MVQYMHGYFTNSTWAIWHMCRKPLNKVGVWPEHKAIESRYYYRIVSNLVSIQSTIMRHLGSIPKCQHIEMHSCASVPLWRQQSQQVSIQDPVLLCTCILSYQGSQYVYLVSVPSQGCRVSRTDVWVECLTCGCIDWFHWHRICSSWDDFQPLGENIY